jgi:hypothetical protein
VKFTEQFSKYACVGDSIRLRISDDVSLVATIKQDDYERPSNSNVYSKDDVARWQKNEWFFCAIFLSLEVRRREVCDCLVSLWGIDCNFDNDNSYLTVVANELLPEALDEAVEWLKDTAKAARAGVKAINANEKEVAE